MNSDPRDSSSEPCLLVDDSRLQHRMATVNGVRLHYVEAGSGPLVLLLHGFPEFWFSWRHQILPLARAGFRVVAPDLRGFNRSEKPHGVAAYGVRRVVADMVTLIAELGASRAHVIGHDFGAGVAWAFAMQHPDLLERLCILNGPHPVRFLSGLWHPSQLLRSWYIFFFQLPYLPELWTRRRGYAALLEPFERLPAHAQPSNAERAAYVTAFEQPGALPAMLNYYRAMFRPSGALRLRRIDADVLVLWGERDPYLRHALAAPSRRWVPRAQVEYLPAGHFVQHELPEQVSERLIAFLRDGAATTSRTGAPAE